MPNQVVWALRSDNSSFNARYSPSGLTPGFGLQLSALAQPTYNVDATAIGGYNFDFSRGSTLSRVASYEGRGIFNSKTISVLMRVKLPAAGLFGLFELNSASNMGANKLSCFWATNDWRVTLCQENGLAGLNNATIITSAPTTGAWIDIVWTWDGTTAANSFKIYVDGTLLAQASPTQAWAVAKDAKLTDYIAVGGVTGVLTTNWLLNEMVFWNYVIDPTSVALTSGTGSLNGASRTAFVDVASYDGTSYTDPGVANVTSGVSYTYAGSSQTGTNTDTATVARYLKPMRVVISYATKAGHRNHLDDLNYFKSILQQAIDG